MTPFAFAILGSVVRTVLGISAGAAAASSVAVDATGSLQVTDDVTALVSAVAGVVTLAWSMYQKRKTAPLV